MFRVCCLVPGNAGGMTIDEAPTFPEAEARALSLREQYKHVKKVKIWISKDY